MFQQIFSNESNEDDFVAWLSRVLQENQTLHFFKTDVAFVPQNTIKLLYEILHIKETHNIEFQDFFALMQQAGEEMEVMRVEDVAQDNFVALPVI